jgi:hypothetical protein
LSLPSAKINLESTFSLMKSRLVTSEVQQKAIQRIFKNYYRKTCRRVFNKFFNNLRMEEFSQAVRATHPQVVKAKMDMLDEVNLAELVKREHVPIYEVKKEENYTITRANILFLIFLGKADQKWCFEKWRAFGFKRRKRMESIKFDNLQDYYIKLNSKISEQKTKNKNTNYKLSLLVSQNQRHNSRITTARRLSLYFLHKKALNTIKPYFDLWRWRKSCPNLTLKDEILPQIIHEKAQSLKILLESKKYLPEKIDRVKRLKDQLLAEKHDLKRKVKR